MIWNTCRTLPASRAATAIVTMADSHPVIHRATRIVERCDRSVMTLLLVLRGGVCTAPRFPLELARINRRLPRQENEQSPQTGHRAWNQRALGAASVSPSNNARKSLASVYWSPTRFEFAHRKPAGGEGDRADDSAAVALAGGQSDRVIS
jgi:hypothetical protein